MQGEYRPRSVRSATGGLPGQQQEHEGTEGEQSIATPSGSSTLKASGAS
jgi:hypothetical protein